MDEVLLKALSEFAFPVLISLYLLTKGVNTMNQFAQSVQELAKTIGDLKERMDKLENKIDKVLKK